MGEANGNDLDNVYLGGAKDQKGVIFLQKADGSSTEIENLILQQLVKAEDRVAEFVEFNREGNWICMSKAGEITSNQEIYFSLIVLL